MGALDGRFAAVTGGASGIGLATSRRLTDEGARVAILDLNEEAGRQVASQLGGEFVRVNVADSADVAKAFETVAGRFGRLDIAYLNAGVTTGTSDITKLTDDEYLRILGINVNGVVFGIREAAKVMTGGGSIVATASLAGLIAYATDPIYALTKHAVVGITRALASQLEGRGITINCICPGIVETPLVGESAAAALKQAGFPLIQPEDIAEAVVRAITSGQTGNAWVCQPGREPVVYEFRRVPGPRTPGSEGMVPPAIRA